jgi:hypothetical protein
MRRQDKMWQDWRKDCNILSYRRKKFWKTYETMENFSFVDTHHATPAQQAEPPKPEPGPRAPVWAQFLRISTP